MLRRTRRFQDVFGRHSVISRSQGNGSLYYYSNWHQSFSQVILPDMEFLMNLGDYPLSNGPDPLPIISWCGSEQTHDIILPTYEITEATLQMLSRTTLDIFAMRATRHLPWANKISKGFFRGRDSCQVSDLCAILFKRKFSLIL
jgi:hypothetical protein